jgi:hypothetical protein
MVAFDLIWRKKSYESGLLRLCDCGPVHVESIRCCCNMSSRRHSNLHRVEHSVGLYSCNLIFCVVAIDYGGGRCCCMGCRLGEM